MNLFLRPVLLVLLFTLSASARGVEPEIPFLLSQKISEASLRRNLLILGGDLPTEPGAKNLPDRFHGRNRQKVRRFLVDQIQALGQTVKRKPFRVKPDQESLDEAIEDFGEFLSAEELAELESGSGAESKTIYGENLVTEVKGVGNPGKVIEVMAHYDSVLPGVRGADDNATGVVAALEILSFLKSYPPEYTVRVIFTDLEEQGFLGAQAHLKSLGRWRSKVEAGVVLDMLGYTPPDHPTQNLAGEVGTQSSHRKMARKLQTQMRSFTNRPVSLRMITKGSLPDTAEHGTYWANNIPGILIGEAFLKGDPYRSTPHYHEQTDIPANVNEPFFLDSARLALESVITLAGVKLTAEQKSELLNSRRAKALLLERNRPGRRDEAVKKVVEKMKTRKRAL